MADLALVMPMAGEGSRFRRAGVATPKPLIELGGRPFFWWAAESVRRAAPLREMVFVVLAGHVRDFEIDVAIRRLYPDARIVQLDAGTAGAAETAALGVAALTFDGPVAINDCDHAFCGLELPALCDAWQAGAAGALVGFPSSDPAYSFVRLAADDPTRVLGAVEKVCIGPYAIAGCYLFRDTAAFARAYGGYAESCVGVELFMSGLYNRLCDLGETVLFQPLGAHLSFGTPAQARRVSPAALAGLIDVATA